MNIFKKVNKLQPKITRFKEITPKIRENIINKEPNEELSVNI